jgi:hypothetical protein
MDEQDERASERSVDEIPGPPWFSGLGFQFLWLSEELSFFTFLEHSLPHWTSWDAASCVSTLADSSPLLDQSVDLATVQMSEHTTPKRRPNHDDSPRRLGTATMTTFSRTSNLISKAPWSLWRRKKPEK